MTKMDTLGPVAAKGAPPVSGSRDFPQALEQAFGDVSLAEQFFDAVNRAAEQAGCEMLFEIPALLFRGTGDRAAAVSCGADRDLLFIIFDSAKGAIKVVAAGEAPETVLDFTRSYAGVLGMIASDHRVVAPLLQ